MWLWTYTLFQMKCLQYWPLEEGTVLTFDDFNIKLRSSNMFSDFSVSHLEVSRVSTFFSMKPFFEKFSGDFISDFSSAFLQSLYPKSNIQKFKKKNSLEAPKCSEDKNHPLLYIDILQFLNSSKVGSSHHLFYINEPTTWTDFRF